MQQYLLDLRSFGVVILFPSYVAYIMSLVLLYVVGFITLTITVVDTNYLSTIKKKKLNYRYNIAINIKWTRK